MLIKTPLKIFFFICLLNLIYWSSTQLHAIYCAPSGFWGLFYTPIMMGSPICYFFIKIINHTTEIYCTIWLGIVGMLLTSVYDLIYSMGFKKSLFTK